jgi:hypothetical protein
MGSEEYQQMINRDLGIPVVLFSECCSTTGSVRPVDLCWLLLVVAHVIDRSLIPSSTHFSLLARPPAHQLCVLSPHPPGSLAEAEKDRIEERKKRINSLGWLASTHKNP